MKNLRSIVLSLLLLTMAAGPAYLKAQDQPVAEDQQAPPEQGAPESSEQLQQLVAPIALYPDSLVAQILNAATYPTQVVEAERWLQQNQGLSGDALAQAVDSQPWDPSVKALIRFPSVLDNMDKNLSWTSSLGDAYYNQSQDVMEAVQVMRRKAEEAGNLRSSPQESVSDQNGQVVIQPANPSVVYVPIYDPWYAYGPPIGVWPGFVYTPWWVPRPFFGFSVGFPLGGWGGYGWGWSAWRFDWGAHRVWYHGAPYVSHSPAFFDRRGYYGDRRGFGGDRPGEVRRGEAPGPQRPAFRGGPPPARSIQGGPVPYHGVERGFTPPATRGFSPPQEQRGVRSGAFGGFSHGGEARANAERGRASFGGGGARGGSGGRH
jgi:hypothetical protein